MNYLAEIEQWREQVARWCGDGARLVHASSFSSDVRIYANGARVFKMRRMSPAAVHDRPNSLEDEHQVLKHIHTRGIRGVSVPEPCSYRRAGEWECLELTLVPPPMVCDPVAHPLRESFRDLLKLARVVWRLNRLGLSHGDLEQGNVGLSKQGGMAMLDFDQAAFAHVLRCVFRDFLGFPAGGRACRCSILGRASRHRWVAPFASMKKRLIRCAGGGRSPDLGPWGPMERAQARNDPQLIALAEAWADAAASGANSPGSNVAYYSLDCDGIHFPGERPWLQRWDAISRVVDFRGKRVVELGCNLGLLSIHVLLSGGVSARGLDANERVTKAAGVAARAFGVDAAFLAADFDRDPDWELCAGTGDIATALSLTYWLKDKERLWRYLSGFSEVIFEGHESELETRQRFAGLGFRAVVGIGISERNRMVFHASR